MATLVLGIVGNFIFPGVGGLLGAAAGGLIDNYLLMPALFPKPDIVGPRMTDFQVQQGAEGSDAKWILGQRNRLAGTVIWMPKKEDGSVAFIEEVNTTGVGKGSGGQSVSNYTYYIDVAIALATTETLPDSKVNRMIRLFGDTKLMYDNGSIEGLYESITFYDGSQTLPDPLIESYEGVGNVPAFKKTCYIVVKKLALAEFGRSSLPNMSAILEQDYDMSLGKAIKRLMVRAGFDEDDILTEYLPQCFAGMMVNGPQSTADVMQPLLLGYGMVIQDTGEGIVFLPRGEEQVITIAENDLSATEEDSRPLNKIEWSDTNDYSLPSECVVTFTSTENDTQQGSQRANRRNFVGQGVIRLNMPVTLQPSEASAMAKRLVWSAEVERKTFKLSLPPWYIHLQQGDAISVVVDGETYELYVQEVTRGVNYKLEISGVVSQPSVWSQTGQPATGTGGIQPALPTETTAIVKDTVPFVDAMADTFGVMYAVAATDPTALWPGAKIYTSNTYSGSYDEKGTANGESAMGVLQNSPVDMWVQGWDEDSVVDVEMTNGELFGCSEQECLNGTNRLMIVRSDGETEIIGFQNVEQLGDRRYRLTKLLRGLCGTDPWCEYHSFGSQVVLLTVTSTNFLDLGSSGLGSNKYYKVGSIGSLLSEVEYDRVEVIGRTKRPFRPTHLNIEVGPDETRSIQGTDLSLNLSGGNYRIESSTTNRFAGIQVGEYVQLGGSASNDDEYLVTAKPDEQTLVVDHAFTLPDTPPNGSYSLGVGQAKDLVITWRRRSKKYSTFPAPGPLCSDETPEAYRVTLHNGGSDSIPLRDEIVGSPKFVYSYADQIADGFPSSNAHINVLVRQVSTQVGDGTFAEKDVYR